MDRFLMFFVFLGGKSELKRYPNLVSHYSVMDPNISKITTLL